MSTRMSDAFSGGINPAQMFATKTQAAIFSTEQLKPKQASLNLVQLEKIKVCNSFTKAFANTGFFDKSFPTGNYAGSNGLDRVTSILMSKALTGNYPDIQLSYTQVLVSKGKLLMPKHAAAVAMKANKIYFSFTDNSNIGSASASDKILLVAYSPKLQKAEYSLNAGCRKNCEAVLKTTSLKDELVETWIGFLNDDETEASNSIYTGRVQL